MTASEFEEAYARESGMSVEQLRERGRIVVPCECGDDLCIGWSSVRRISHDEFDRTIDKLSHLLQIDWLRLRFYVRELRTSHAALLGPGGIVELLHRAEELLTEALTFYRARFGDNDDDHPLASALVRFHRALHDFELKQHGVPRETLKQYMAELDRGESPLPPRDDDDVAGNAADTL